MVPHCIILSSYFEKSCLVVEIFENHFFHTVPAFDVRVTPLGGPRRNVTITLATKKTRMVWLPDGENSLMTRLAVTTQ